MADIEQIQGIKIGEGRSLLLILLVLWRFAHIPRRRSLAFLVDWQLSETLLRCHKNYWWEGSDRAVSQ